MRARTGEGSIDFPSSKGSVLSWLSQVLMKASSSRGLLLEVKSMPINMPVGMKGLHKKPPVFEEDIYHRALMHLPASSSREMRPSLSRSKRTKIRWMASLLSVPSEFKIPPYLRKQDMM